MATKKLKNATIKTTKQTTTTKKPAQPKTNLTKTTQTKKPQIGQNSNPFADKYLEFYDDIKIPTRRYDW